jgi:hypothetical protein
MIDTHTHCSDGTNLPMQVKSIKKAETSIDLKYVDDGTYDASYDIYQGLLPHQHPGRLRALAGRPGLGDRALPGRRGPTLSELSPASGD